MVASLKVTCRQTGHLVDDGDDDVDVYVVWRCNDSFVNVQHGNVTTHCCFILFRHPTELRPTTKRKPIFFYTRYMIFKCFILDLS